MPSWKPTIITMILAAACVGTAWFTWSRDLLGRASAGTIRALYEEAAIPAGELATIMLTRRGEPTLTFTRDGTEWRQTTPFEYSLEPYSMQRFAAIANQLTVARTFEPGTLPDGQTPASLSLDPPLATLTFAWPGGQETLSFGMLTAGGRGYLKRNSDDTIYVVDRELHERVLNESPNLWRDPRLFEFAGQDSRLVEVNLRVGTPYTMAREAGRWRLTLPLETRLNQDAVAQRLGELAELHTQNFIADEPTRLEEYGLTNPLATITVTTPVVRMIDGRPVREDVVEQLLVGAARSLDEREFFVMIEGRPVVVALSRQAIDQLLAFGHLIDKTASGVDPANVGSIRISGDVEFNIERDRDDPRLWTSPEFDGTPANASAVVRLLSQLTELLATAVDVGDYPFDREVAYITISGLDSMPLDAVRIAHLEDGTWILNNGDGLLRLYPPGLQLPLEPKSFGLE